MFASITRKSLAPLMGVLLLILSPAAAFAHAAVVSSTPQSGSSSSFMPKEIRITFSENLMQLKGKEINSLSLSYMKNSDLGIGITLTNLKVDQRTISAKVPNGQYKTGNYVVTYTIVSEDGHKVTDSIPFTLHSFGSTLKSTAPKAVQAKGDGVLPLPIVGAIALVIALGGLFALRARTRKS